jgi:anti-sigma-K factor RskA
MTTRDDIRDDLPLYALGALDAEERRAVEAALADDPGLADELREWTELTGLMALEAPDAVPPELKAKLLTRVRGGAATAAASKVARRRIGWALPLAAAAGALLAVATYREIGWRTRAHDWQTERGRQAEAVASLQRSLDAAQGDLAKVAATLRAREDDVASLRTTLSQAQESLSILHSRGLNLVSLKETKDSPPAAGHVLLSPPTGRALFYAFDLPDVPPDKAYELWWITEKQGPVMAGMFRPDAHGLGRVEASLPSDAGAITAAAVTVEAANGVPKPQGPMVLLGAMSTS